MDRIEMLTFAGVAFAALTLFFMMFQWFRNRTHRSLAFATSPIISLDRKEIPVEITIINSGERTFNIDSVCIWLHARNSWGVEYAASLTEIGKTRLEDGEKITKTFQFKKYLDGIIEQMGKDFSFVDKLVRWKIEIYLRTTTGTKLKLKIDPALKQLLIRQIKTSRTPS